MPPYHLSVEKKVVSLFDTEEKTQEQTSVTNTVCRHSLRVMLLCPHMFRAEDGGGKAGMTINTKITAP